MTSKKLPKTGLKTVGIILIPFVLMACANTAERGGPDSRKGERAMQSDRSGQFRARTSGTFIRPISLVFADMDQNDDKALSLLELENGIEKEWASFERAPSAVYFSNWSIKTFGSNDANPTFMMFDKDLNGVVSKAEFATLFTERFRRFDENGDGILERRELVVSFEAPRGERARNGQSSNRQGRGQRGGGRLPR